MRPAHHLAEPVEPHKGWRACWGRFHCFASSSRKRRRPTPQLLAAPNPTSNGNLQISDSAPSSSSLSPLVRAPPSSPAYFPYSDPLPSPSALLTLFPLKSAEDLCGRGMTQADSAFPILDPVLVTPPLHSTLTTEPTTPLSTAPFTPPPELAHLTTPPSPEVPFAEVVASSLSFKCGPQELKQSKLEEATTPLHLELAYQLYLGSPVATGELNSPRSRTSVSETDSPLPERVPFLEDDATGAPFTPLLQAPIPFGFNQVASADEDGHGSSERVYQHRSLAQKDGDVETENVILEMQLDEKCRNYHAQTVNMVLENAECSCSAITELISGQVELGLDGTSVCESSSKAPKDPCIERIQHGTDNFTDREQSENSGMSHHEEQSKEAGSILMHASASTMQCLDKHLDGMQPAGKSTTCGVLASKCRSLSHALHETKEKRNLIENKENIMDDREKKFKQLIQWLQLEAKTQQTSISRLSEELSWQESALLDLQAQYLAELGIEIPATGKEFSRT